jgi:hypothetical protein
MRNQIQIYLGQQCNLFKIQDEFGDLCSLFCYVLPIFVERMHFLQKKVSINTIHCSTKLSSSLLT